MLVIVWVLDCRIVKEGTAPQWCRFYMHACCYARPKFKPYVLLSFSMSYPGKLRPRVRCLLTTDALILLYPLHWEWNGKHEIPITDRGCGRTSHCLGRRWLKQVSSWTVLLLMLVARPLRAHGVYVTRGFTITPASFTSGTRRTLFVEVVQASEQAIL